jgi:diguanylate cyclase (GGDEF)-like protein/PAS domain S-box-containing protein
MYAALSALNELVAQARSAEALLQGTCEIAVASGDFDIAVVRHIEREAQLAGVAAFAGAGPMPFLEQVIDLDPAGPEADSLVTVAYWTGRPAIARDAELVGRLPFTETPVRFQTRAAGAFPLLREGECVAVLVLRSRRSDALEGEVAVLLERMARQVSHGLDGLAAQEVLRRFRLALDHSADMILLIERSSLRVVDANETACRLLGYARQDLLRMHADEVFVQSRDALACAYHALVADPSSSGSLRTLCRRADGSRLPVESTRRAMRSGGHWIVVEVGRDTRDLDAAAEADEALRQKDAYFRSLVENVSDTICATDMEWRYVYVSPSSVALVGYPPEALLGTRFGDTTVVGDPAAVRERLARLLEQSPAPQSARLEVRRKDGEPRTLEVLVSKGIGPASEPIYVLACRDVTDRIRAEEALRRREEELRALAQNSPDGIFRFDAELRCTFVNAAVERITGWSAESLIGRTLWDPLMPESVRAIWEPAIRRVLAVGELNTVEYSYAGPKGVRHYQARFAPERTPQGVVASVLVISRDISERRRAERAIAESEARLRRIVEAAATPLLLVEPDGTTLFANPAAAALFGCRAAELEGAPLGLPLLDGRPADVEIPLPGGGVRAAEMRFTPTELEGRPLLVVSLHDLSERKRYEAHIQHLANHDALTGLANRTLLRDRVAQAIAHARRTGSCVALMFIDLDQFKLVNDSWGHAFGDKLLLEVGNRLQGAVRDGDTVARLGGDEFVIVLVDLAQPGDTAVVSRKIADALARPVRFGGRELRVTASMGISLFPNDGDDLDALLQCADAAMYRAKDEGRNTFQYYSAEMGMRARARAETEAGLRRALEHEELRLHYQPQLDLATGDITGFEALLRWEDPGRGLVSPAAFIPVAEESGLIVPIGHWALRAACREVAGWTAAGHGAMKLAVNLSARQFWQGSVLQSVRAALEESGLPPAQLELEITESVVARDLDKVMRTLEQLRRMGVSVAIDDFGTGYSSLGYLRSLPIQKLKIDRSFVQGIPEDREATALVGEIVRLAHVLSLTAVAEGVETQAQAAYLRAAGCEAMQGFLFSRPLPAADCLALLRSGRRLRLDGA